MTNNVADPLVDLATCAAMLGLTKSGMQRLCAEAAWVRGDLPAPVYVGRGSGTVDRYGRRGGRRRWRVSAIEAFIAEHTAASA